MKKLVLYIPTALIAGLIGFLSLLREPSRHFSVLTFPHFDKVVHILMYLFLSAVFSFDLRRAGVVCRPAFLWAICLPAFYGGVLELLQEYYFPPRTGDWLDWGADLLGSFLGVIFAIGLCPRKQH